MQTSSEAADELAFDEVLSRRSKNRKIPKRERTRYQILAEMAKRLKTQGRENLNVDFITDKAGLSRGTFYNNFKDIEEAKIYLVKQFLEYSRDPQRSAAGGEAGRNENRKFESKSYEAVLETNKRFCKSYQANAQIYSLFSELAMHNPEILKLREKMNADWVEKIVCVMERRRGQPFDTEEKRCFKGVLRLLIAMTIEALRERYVHEDTLLSESFPTAENLAEMLSQIWYKTMSDYRMDTERRLQVGSRDVAEPQA